MKKLIMVIGMVLTSCATSEHRVKEIEKSEFKPLGRTTDDGRIGLNEKKEVIIQKETTGADELRIQEAVNMHFQSKVESELYSLKTCRKDLADPRLGGRGEISPVQDIDDMKSVDEVREEMGLKDGELVVVKEQYFEQKMKNARSYFATLQKMLKLTERHKEECEAKMAVARREAGLPGQRIRGEGYFMTGGVWVQTKRNETSLDDAFEISAKNGNGKMKPSNEE